eukprot:7732354-Lingulodinium_polyedra.AAC.1
MVCDPARRAAAVVVLRRAVSNLRVRRAFPASPVWGRLRGRHFGAFASPLRGGVVMAVFSEAGFRSAPGYSTAVKQVRVAAVSGCRLVAPEAFRAAARGL